MGAAQRGSRLSWRLLTAKTAILPVAIMAYRIAIRIIGRPEYELVCFGPDTEKIKGIAGMAYGGA